VTALRDLRYEIRFPENLDNSLLPNIQILKPIFGSFYEFHWSNLDGMQQNIEHN
jgi:hypothetical protein